VSENGSGLVVEIVNEIENCLVRMIHRVWMQAFVIAGVGNESCTLESEIYFDQMGYGVRMVVEWG
jgi:hypothetical protein